MKSFRPAGRDIFVAESGDGTAAAKARRVFCEPHEAKRFRSDCRPSRRCEVEAENFVNRVKRSFRIEAAILRNTSPTTPHPMKHLKSSLFALLAVPALASAHPGHSLLDPTAGGPHAGHEAEFLLFLLPALAVVALAVRAYRQSRE